MVALIAAIFIGIFISCQSTPGHTPEPVDQPANEPSFVPQTTVLFVSPTPTPTVPAGVEAASASFIDDQGGYQLSLPAGWTSLEATSQEAGQILSAAAFQNPGQSGFYQLDKGLIRLIALAGPEDHAASLIADLDPESQGLPVDFLLASSAQQSQDILPGAQLLKAEVQTNQHGVEIGEMEIILPARETSTDMYERKLILQTRKGCLWITMLVDAKARSQVIPQLDAIAASIEWTGAP